MGKTLVGGAELCKILGISVATRGRWQRAGILPEPIRRPGMHPRWIMEEIQEVLGKKKAA